MAELKQLTINGKTYKLVDEQARKDAESLDNTVRDLNRKVTELEFDKANTAVQYIKESSNVTITSPVVVVSPYVNEISVANYPNFAFSIYFAKLKTELGPKVAAPPIKDYNFVTLSYFDAEGGYPVTIYKGKWYTVGLDKQKGQVLVEQ